jgi:hypothetical protein
MSKYNYKIQNNLELDTPNGKIFKELTVYVITTGFADLDKILDLEKYISSVENNKYNTIHYVGNSVFSYGLFADTVRLSYGCIHHRGILRDFEIDDQTASEILEFERSFSIEPNDKYECEVNNAVIRFFVMSGLRLRIMIILKDYNNIVVETTFCCDELIGFTRQSVIDRIVGRLNNIKIFTYHQSNIIEGIVELKGAAYYFHLGKVNMVSFKFNNYKSIVTVLKNYIEDGTIPQQDRISSIPSMTKRAI